MVVIGLPAVGVVLMAAMLILPGAAARFWTDRLESMLALAALLGAVVGALGTLASAQFSLTPAGPVIVLVGSAVFGVSLLVAPRHGLLARWWAARSFAQRLDEQRILAWLHDHDPPHQPGQRARYRVGDLPASFRHRENLQRRRIHRLIIQGQLDAMADGSFRLSPSGRERAACVVRGWRLWQAFILAYPDLAQGYAELDAEDIDERLPPDTIAELEATLRRAGRWPDLAKPADRQGARA
jgi:manganese/zinc/iron transport system permease protein